MRRHLLPTVLVCATLAGLLSADALAHWCSNIWTGAARLVVKAEKSTLVVPTAGSVQLRVYLQNNFPYRIFNMQLRGVAAGYTIVTTPTSQHIHPGQNVSYMLTVSGTAGTVAVTTLNLQVAFRVGGWRTNSDWLVNQTPSQANLVSSSTYGGGNAQQAPSLHAATLSDMFASATLPAGTPTFGRTGIQQLIKMFGYRFCYNDTGGYRCGSSDCPGACAEGTAWPSIEQWPQDCMRAGIELGVRKANLGSNLAAARDGAINAMKGAGSAEHECVAAVVGAYLWQGAADTSPFTTALTGNGVSAICVAAGQRILGGASSTCGSGTYYERAACGAAEGISGNDAVVTSVLMANAGDGDSTASYNSLYYAYMLSLVTAHRRATAGGVVSYYPDAGGPTPGCTGPADCNDNNVCTTDTCTIATGACSNPPIAGCCTTNTQCTDGDVCTADTCNTTSHTCVFSPIAGCCTLSTQCNDSNVCTTDTCNTTTHVCQFAPIASCCTAAGQCNDSNSCTTDTCNTTTNTCVFTPLTGCCTTNAQCSDSNVCTTDTCNVTNGTCSNTPVAGCCTTAAQCDDSNLCTTDTCNTATGVCGHAPVAGCCTTVAECNDNNACTTDTCNTTTHVCTNAPIAACCNTNAQCTDSNACTADTCNTTSHTCQFTAISGCCATAATCDDGNKCTTDTCDATAHTCQHAAIGGCCTTDASCKDNNPCTVDTCTVATGTCTNAKQSGCCAVDTDCDDGNSCTLDKCDTTATTCSHTQTCVEQGVAPVDAGVGDRGALGDSAKSGADRNTASLQPALQGGCTIGLAAATASSPGSGLALVVGLLLVGAWHRRRRAR